MFYARAYRLPAARIGVNDYRDLVADKLQTARELYESMVNEFDDGLDPFAWNQLLESQTGRYQCRLCN